MLQFTEVKQLTSAPISLARTTPVIMFMLKGLKKLNPPHIHRQNRAKSRGNISNVYYSNYYFY